MLTEPGDPGEIVGTDKGAFTRRDGTTHVRAVGFFPDGKLKVFAFIVQMLIGAGGNLFGQDLAAMLG